MMIVRRNELIPLGVRLIVVGFRNVTGPAGLTLADSVIVPWKPFRLWRVRVCVKFCPGLILKLVGVVPKAKSVAVRLMIEARVIFPSVAVTMI